MNSLFCGLSQEIFKRIHMCSTAYEIWEYLESTYSSHPADNDFEQFLIDPSDESNGDALLEEVKTDTSSKRGDEHLSLDEKSQGEDDKGTLCSNLASSKSAVRNSNSLRVYKSVYTLNMLNMNRRRLKKLKNINSKLRLENNLLKANVSVESSTVVSSSHVYSLEDNSTLCINCEKLKEKREEEEKECISLREQNEKLFLENLASKGECAKCVDYRVEITEMSEVFEEYRNQYEAHINSIVAILKNSTTAYTKARTNLKQRNEDLETKINVLKEILKKKFSTHKRAISRKFQTHVEH
ncbi:hypothetical protein KSP40_PGU020383 [Platanthera guangdongensis]|uniref:Uncharacterized protein n=1 Tax=Platanthera guangdongensis TaxID=2320717 RepID=A0ABR2LQQ9_9ASPA